jgi:hypothetical protein
MKVCVKNMFMGEIAFVTQYCMPISKCGMAIESSHDVVVWNFNTFGHSICAQAWNILELFWKMQHEGLSLYHVALDVTNFFDVIRAFENGKCMNVLMI